MPVSPDGLLNVDALLAEDERDVVTTVRAMLDDHVRPHIGRWFLDGALPVRELTRQFGQLGLLGMHLEGYDCPGATATMYGLACRELEAVDSGVRSLVSVQGSLAMYAIHRWGTEQHKQQWLPGMAAGELIGCFGLTEPDAGSDPAAMRTVARRDGDDWVSTAPRCGSPTRRSPTSRWCGRVPTRACGGSWCRVTLPGFSAPEVPGKLSLGRR
jgi:glutaryl-CoA dehydrogenase